MGNSWGKAFYNVRDYIMIMEDCQGEKGCLEGGEKNILEEKSDKENYYKKTNKKK